MLQKVQSEHDQVSCSSYFPSCRYEGYHQKLEVVYAIRFMIVGQCAIILYLQRDPQKEYDKLEKRIIEVRLLG